LRCDRPAARPAHAVRRNHHETVTNQQEYREFFVDPDRTALNHAHEPWGDVPDPSPVPSCWISVEPDAPHKYSEHMGVGDGDGRTDHLGSATRFDGRTPGDGTSPSKAGGKRAIHPADGARALRPQATSAR